VLNTLTPQHQNTQTVLFLMKLIIANIPIEGQKISLSPKDGWVREIVHEALPVEKPDMNQIAGSLEITRLDENLSLRGSIDIMIHPACDRCLEFFVYPLQVTIHMDLTPLYHSSAEKDKISGYEQEMELSKEDLEFSFYEGEEVDLKRYIREQIVLSLPPRFICSEDCKGLCPQCGVNLNQKTCPCHKGAPVDIRWEVLKGFKSRRE